MTSGSATECDRLVKSGTNAKLNVFILGKFKNENRTGGAYPRTGGSNVFIFAQTIASHQFSGANHGTPITDTGKCCRTIAHEIGHALNLSTRHDYDRRRNYGAVELPHDPGPFPKYKQDGAESVAVGLMHYLKPDIWMRHEDWEAANNAVSSKGYGF